jgi:thioredoxin 1
MRAFRIWLFLFMSLTILLVPLSCDKTADTLSRTDQTGTTLTSIPLPDALTNGKPTLAEFGRGTCIPCKEMKPILENLALEYKGLLNVPIVSVDEYASLTNYYRVMAIPTQIVFDSSGKEVSRHIGVWPEQQIVEQLSKLGIMK